MSSAGHVLDMINRMKYNRSVQKSIRKRFKEQLQNREAIHARKNYSGNRYRQIPKEEIEQLKSAIRQKAKKQQIRILIIYLVVFAVLGTGLILFLLHLL